MAQSPLLGLGVPAVKIGLAIDRFDPRRGGAEQVVYQHAQGLLARGHEVHVVAEVISSAGAQLPIVPHPIGIHRSRTGRAEAVGRAFRSIDLDLTHDYGVGWHGDVLQSEDGSRIAQWRQKLKTLPLWARPLKRGMIEVMPRYREFRKLMARQFGDPKRVVLAVSKMCAADYQRYNRVPSRQIRLVYHGTDNRRFSPEHRQRYRQPVRSQWKVQEDEVLFLFVGHDFYRKGLATAIRALGHMIAEGLPARLMVIGGKRHRRFSRLAQQLGAAEAVSFVGTITDPVPFYAAADVHVLPTFYDPCSLSVSEAAASGLPNITTRFNGAGELLTEGVDGYVLADAADDHALADRMRRLMDHALRQRMSAAARQLALEYSLDRNCEQIIEIYQEIAGRRRIAA